MQKMKEKITLIVTGIVYLVFNLRPAAEPLVTVKATLYQIASTAPYVAGVTLIVVATLQYMSDGQKVPWDRRLRLFFTIGIIAGFVYAIFEYAGVK